eukprot:m.343212 g.343212  ORF g.343212 m.343212 type:complete len:251 (-) comp22517_c0_seq1:163-915(-)
MDDTLVQALLTGQEKRYDENESAGYWSPHTAPIKWCEISYAVTPYVAEFHNTWTNLAYIIVGLQALYYSIKRKDGIFMSGISIMTTLTGVFSLTFHATLQWKHQKLDEIFENGILIFMLYHGVAPFHFATIHFCVCSYLIWTVESFNFCEVHLISIILCVIAKFTSMLSRYPVLKREIATSVMCLLCGFSCWLVDRLACSTVRSLQINIAGVTFYPEFHALWHIATAAALRYAIRGVSIVDKEMCNKKQS